MCVSWCENLENAGRVYHWLEAISGKGLVYYLKLYLEGLAKFFEQNELRQAEH